MSATFGARAASASGITATLACWQMAGHRDRVTDANQQAIRAFFAGLDEEAHDLAERLAHGDDESVWAWFERRYPKATKRAAKDRHWREFVRAIREFYGDESPLQ
ncbi:MAG: hypothetical protein JO203_10985 [Gammaproteobacteria bacterium]|nr:hypothetical protein [Gammaproteobacteria bacterium]